MKKDTEKLIVSLLGPKWRMRLVILGFLIIILAAVILSRFF